MVTPKEEPHRRYNPLEDSWVLVSPHRTQRPWLGEETPKPPARPEYDEQCYLCPGNPRAGGQLTPAYQGVYVFDNDYPALLPGAEDAQAANEEGSPLFQMRKASGRCRVICYSPKHNLALGHLQEGQRLEVVETWSQEFQQLSQDFAWVQIFENRGAAMGASNPHPHGQVWAVDHLPSIANRELLSQVAYLRTQGSLLLLDYAQQEIEQQARVVYQNAAWLAVVPYWASWPFEILLLPLQPVASLGVLTREQQGLLGHTLGKVQQCYDALFDCEFPYSFGWHNAPNAVSGEIEGVEAWQLHAHFYPPLLRSATVKKFMVGYEMLAEAQRDLTPELAAQRLREALNGLG